jgi:hypothetical protein
MAAKAYENNGEMAKINGHISVMASKMAWHPQMKSINIVAYQRMKINQCGVINGSNERKYQRKRGEKASAAKMA